MTNTEQQIRELEKKAREELHAAEDATTLEQWRVVYIGRSGQLPEILRNVKNLPVNEKKVVGKMANELRRTLEELYAEKQQQIAPKSQQKKHEKIPLEAGNGHLHPLTLTIQRIQDIFCAMGFVIADGPEVEEDKYNFDAINIPLEHPARGEDQTFFVSPDSINGQKGLSLRTSTSPMQIRSVQEMKLHPPFSVIAPGRVFRKEKADATHESTFYQFEGLSISEDTTIADFKAVIETFFSIFFDANVTIRLRPSYFPFVEPGFEVDMSCPFCKEGCRVCKYSRWIEVMGAGMVHPNVLKNMNVDPEKYQGFAFGGAIDRLTMIRHGISDIRLFWSGDIRFLRQFS